MPREPTEQEWEDRRETIRQLWLVQSLSMNELMESMKALGFYATKRQFEYQIRERWEWRKRLSGLRVVPQGPRGDTDPDHQTIISDQRLITAGDTFGHYPSVDTNTLIWSGITDVQPEGALALDESDTCWAYDDNAMGY